MSSTARFSFRLICFLFIIIESEIFFDFLSLCLYRTEYISVEMFGYVLTYIWILLEFDTSPSKLPSFEFLSDIDEIKLLIFFLVQCETTGIISSFKMDRTFLAPLQFQKQFVRNLLLRQQPNKKHVYKRVGNAKPFGNILFYAK